MWLSIKNRGWITGKTLCHTPQCKTTYVMWLHNSICRTVNSEVGLQTYMIINEESPHGLNNLDIDSNAFTVLFLHSLTRINTCEKNLKTPSTFLLAIVVYNESVNRDTTPEHIRIFLFIFFYKELQRRLREMHIHFKKYSHYINLADQLIWIRYYT